MKAGGFTPEDFEADDVDLWPENWPTWQLFCALQTQWFAGMNGREGLRYEALYPLLDRYTDSPTEWERMFDDIRAMEAAALIAMNGNS